MKKIFIALRLIVLLYVLLLLIVYGGQRWIVFQPKSLAPETTFPFDTPFEEHFLETTPDLYIHFIHFKTKQPAKGLVLYFHGNKGNLLRWGKFHRDFVKRGYEVIMPDYRGYGKSGGTVSEVETYRDMHMLCQWVQDSIAPHEIILYGRSLGSGIASHLAKDVDAKYLILATPFYDIPSLFRDQLLQRYLPFDFRYHFPNYQNIPQVDCPVYILQGTKDRVVPYRNARRLEAVLNPKDHFITIPKATHRNIHTFEKYQEVLDSLLLGTLHNY